MVRENDGTTENESTTNSDEDPATGLEALGFTKLEPDQSEPDPETSPKVEMPDYITGGARRDAWRAIDTYPHSSNKSIASEIGVDRTTVSKARQAYDDYHRTETELGLEFTSLSPDHREVVIAAVRYPHADQADVAHVADVTEGVAGYVINKYRVMIERFRRDGFHVYLPDDYDEPIRGGGVKPGSPDTSGEADAVAADGGTGHAFGGFEGYDAGKAIGTSRRTLASNMGRKTEAGEAPDEETSETGSGLMNSGGSDVHDELSQLRYRYHLALLIAVTALVLLLIVIVYGIM